MYNESCKQSQTKWKDKRQAAEIMSNVMKEQISAEKDPMGNGFVVDSYDDPLIALELGWLVYF